MVVKAAEPTRKSLIKNSGDRGDHTISYLGIVVLIAAIIAAIFALGLPGKIAGGIDTQVNNILGGNANGAAPAKPQQCTAPKTWDPVKKACV